jgi:hypothetical protein
MVLYDRTNLGSRCCSRSLLQESIGRSARAACSAGLEAHDVRSNLSPRSSSLIQIALALTISLSDKGQLFVN